MPLTKRQKRRLAEVSRMIESSISVKDDMEELQLEYSQEIDRVVNMIQSQSKISETEINELTSSPVLSKKALNIEKARATRKQRRKIIEDPIKEDNSPEWAKKLWKGIAKKCHPDRLSFVNLTALEIAKRQTWFLEARNLYEKQSWPKLILLKANIEFLYKNSKSSFDVLILFTKITP